jgi:hypothetical protein
VYCFHVPHCFRHFGRDLGEVFWAVYMFETVLELLLVGVVHVYHDVAQLFWGEWRRYGSVLASRLVLGMLVAWLECVLVGS